MKIRLKFVTAFFVLLLMPIGFSVFTVKAEQLYEEAETAPDNVSMSEIPVPDDAPPFHAVIEYTFEGYVIKGTFTEFPDDISQVRTLYSLDGKIWQECGEAWDLNQTGADDSDKPEKLQTQICLYSSFEPLKSYLAGTLDLFYLKLRLTKQNGLTYESQAAVIDRGEPQPIPEGITLTAAFAPSMFLFEREPFCCYGQYQLTVNAGATPEEVSAFLPSVLPIEIQLHSGNDFVTKGIVDCPVTWKPLSFSSLSANESITVPDAAREITVPAGTLLNTPIGIFRLDETLALSQYNMDIRADEVRLVLNAVSEDGNPTGVLSAESSGLEMAFDLKPTGAAAIRAYIFSDHNTSWVNLPDLSLLEAVNAQPSTANSGYTFVLGKDQEPYRSYLSAMNMSDSPAPFYVGLKIEGGVYDGRQLVLSWPDTYELPPDLPDIGGAGGNEGNAGADNKNDSTEEGQRPNLPQDPIEEPEMNHETAAPPNNESASENRQNSEGMPTPEQFHTSLQPAPEANAETNSEKEFPPTASPTNAETDSTEHMTVPETLPAEPAPSAAPVSSPIENTSDITGTSYTSKETNDIKSPGTPKDSDTVNMSESENQITEHKLFRPMAVVMITTSFLCIIIAAAKLSANGGPGSITRRLLNIFKKIPLKK